MAAESRTQKSLRNAKVALLFSVLTFALGFFSRKILMDALGADVLGLYTTAYNLCGFLNLAEMGITSAIAFSLYKPIYDGNREAIMEIVSIQGWLFRKVGVAMCVGAAILMMLFPVFFNEEKTNLPMWYSYATFGVVFVSQVLGYFFCYEQTLLSADQQDYKVTFASQGVRVLKIVLQIVGIGFMGMGYEYWLLVEGICGVVTLLVLRYFIDVSYPWLKCHKTDGGKWINSYPTILTKVKQMMVHKICFAVIDRVTPIIVYGLMTLTVVAIYGNYMMLIANIGILIRCGYNSITASLGNLVSEGDNKKVELFYRTCIAFQFWFASIVCYCLYHLVNPFMELWMGADYLFDKDVVAILIIYAFVEFTCCTDPFVNAYGLYQDIWAPIIKLIINISLSIILGLLFGIGGVIIGVTISLILVYGIWKPYFLYTRGFGESPLRMVLTMVWAMVLIVFSWLVADWWIEWKSVNILSWIEFIRWTMVIMVIYATICTLLFVGGMDTFRRMLVKLIKQR